MSTAPRIPRIPTKDRVVIARRVRRYWYEITPLRVALIVVGTMVGAVAGRWLYLWLAGAA